MAKKQKFDPNAPASKKNGIFGLPYSLDDAELVIIPVPWDVTTSYGSGTSQGPSAILEASRQVDLFLKDIPSAWENKIAMLEVPKKLLKQNNKVRKLVEEYLELLENKPKELKSKEAKEKLKQINAACESMNDWVYVQSQTMIRNGKKPVLLGGDHSTPLGHIKAIAETGPISILHIDAHCDLRKSYENFKFSHASIMYNVLGLEHIKNIVQVGIRDWCEEEQAYIDSNNKKVQVWYDEDMKSKLYNGKKWSAICGEIIKKLSKRVYISIDIDGLDPKLCPNTGTPVPGGLDYYELLFLVKKLVTSGKEIVSFDLVEVAPGKDQWDANVGARLLYQLSNQMLYSSNKKK